MKKGRLAAAVFALGCFMFVTFTLGRAYRERRAVEDAREVLEQLGRMQVAHKRLAGVYTEDLGALADLTDDWGSFMRALDEILDLKAGFQMTPTRAGYKITARARDSARTVVTLEGPPPKSITQASKPAPVLH